MTRPTMGLVGTMSCLAIALLIVVFWKFFSSSSSPTERALEEAEYNAFKTQTAQLLSTLNAGDLLSMDGGESYMIVKFVTGDQLHLYSINDTARDGLHYRVAELINFYGKRNYSVIRSDDPNWKTIVLQQMLW